MDSWFDAASLPKFHKPPVTETAMGFEFPTLPNASVIPLVELQQVWRDSYPLLNEQPGSPPTRLEVGFPSLEFSTGFPPIRILAGGAGDQQGLLLQSQADRFFLNWLKDRAATDRYPGFQHLRSEFSARWQQFSSYFAHPTPLPILAEFTYVNPVGVTSEETLESVFTIFEEPKEPLPGSPRVSRFQFEREVDPEENAPLGARLVLTGEPQNGPFGVWIAVTVSAKVIVSPGTHDPMTAVDAAHALASTAFANITSAAKHREWERYA